MPYFAIRYALKYETPATRRQLCDELERLGGIEAADLFYLVELDGTAAEVHDYLRTYMTSRDLLIVIPFDQRPEIAAALTGAAEWVDERFPPLADDYASDPVARGVTDKP